MSDCGLTYVRYSARGLPRYEVEVTHAELHKHQVIRGDDRSIVERKALIKAMEWDAIWESRLEKEQESIRQKEGKEHATQRREEERAAAQATKTAKKQEADIQTAEAQRFLCILGNILKHTLTVNDAIDWETLKDRRPFPTDQPSPPSKNLNRFPLLRPLPPSLPSPPPPLVLPEKPRRASVKYQPRISVLERLSKTAIAKREREAEEEFIRDHALWEKDAREKYERHRQDEVNHCALVKTLKQRHVTELHDWERCSDEFYADRDAANQCAKDMYSLELTAWQKRRAKYLEDQDRANAVIDSKRELYLKGDPDAVYDYCDMVLSRSQYPDFFPKTYDIDYNPDTKILIADYALPSIDDIPTLKEVRYNASRDEFTEKHLTYNQVTDLYDSVLYQTALRSIHELFEADVCAAIDAVVFNGIVTSVDPSIGKETTKCILSVQAFKKEFMEINIAAVDPKACFKKLKGIGSSQLHTMTPVAPVMQLEREDSRFIPGYEVVDALDSATNLAVMDWQDFEHLIREIFEKEFTGNGGEVKVTRASRDGGVDAVVFDPDPIRGGKIVIQAKRYANTVGVSAVRDLYGTLVNEGANKGILVSTADFGPDAYEFARGKPITLLNGGHLLHLLQKHGHAARIDLKEARQLLAEGKESL